MKVYLVCVGEKGEGYRVINVSRSFEEASDFIKDLNKENAQIEAELKEEIDDEDFYGCCYVLPEELKVGETYYTKSGVDYVRIEEFET